MSKSVDQKLFDAYQGKRGVTLTGSDVLCLLRDNAIGARITNVACQEAGVTEAGCDYVYHSGLSWERFKTEMKEQANAQS